MNGDDGYTAPGDQGAGSDAVFWVVEIAATTLGETGGDAVTMSMKPGYLVGTAMSAMFSTSR